MSRIYFLFIYFLLLNFFKLEGDYSTPGQPRAPGLIILHLTATWGCVPAAQSFHARARTRLRWSKNIKHGVEADKLQIYSRMMTS